jgi:hypothetical protein
MIEVSIKLDAIAYFSVPLLLEGHLLPTGFCGAAPDDDPILPQSQFNVVSGELIIEWPLPRLNARIGACTRSRHDEPSEPFYVFGLLS